ncbi:DUF3791 domain-containing protein [Parablautia muri]|uniref:DUF3791 domain-containing protein n=1 Tax=Parablautia muri TaxID=2320879 RepID=A0A9X5GRQ3_9FIRM|nr:DUF3791 domain-containing protein [Parablautia muri]NBJ92574.1 DUF3791 domain-containing protein [Parablautia muri]
MNADPQILQMKYTDVVKNFAERMRLTLDEALKFFYHSEVYQLMKDGISDMHCMSVAYLVEDLKTEYQEKLQTIGSMED